MPSPNPTAIAFDFGAKRIGVAVASLIARLPRPAGVVDQSSSYIDDIRNLIRVHEVKHVVVGLPRSLDGNDTAQTATVRQFSKELSTKLGLPVFLQDEAVTSKQAEAELQKRGVSFSKEDVDSLAAVYILEDFLNAHPEVK